MLHHFFTGYGLISSTWQGDADGMRKPRIIIFDDDSMILEVLHNYFVACDYEVQFFKKPTLCRCIKNSVSCQSPCADIMITDYSMPGLTGIELLDNQTRHGCSIDVRNKAIMSGELPDRNRDKMKGLAGSFFQKPFHLRELYEWTHECLGRVDLSQPLGNYTTS
jgi:DNA-binding NtrC family response regulator